jgi:hypothetical protein
LATVLYWISSVGSCVHLLSSLPEEDHCVVDLHVCIRALLGSSRKLELLMERFYGVTIVLKGEER